MDGNVVLMFKADAEAKANITEKPRNSKLYFWKSIKSHPF
jgi:hypothetical protein